MTALQNGKPKLTAREQKLRRVGKLLRRLLVASRSLLDEELKPREVTSAQLRMLYEVRNRPGASGAQLARTCAVTPQTAQAMLARAVERGWLIRGKDAENQRLVTFCLTGEGERMLAEGEAAARGIEAKVWRGIRNEEVDALGATLERALANIADHDRL